MKRILHDIEAEEKYNQLKKEGLIIFECIVGSQAYGTAIEGSDVDKKFIYIETLDSILSDQYVEQLNVNKDYVGYELGRFCELIATGNPNLLDLLNTPDDCIIECNLAFKTNFIDNLDKFLTKQVENTFARYAEGQIEKASGLNKKARNPMPKKRPTLDEFMWVEENGKTFAVKEYLCKHYLSEEALKTMCGLSALEHMKNCYALYIDFTKTREYNYKGLITSTGTQPQLSSIPKGERPLTLVYVNIEGFQTECKKHKDYWSWVENRNELRWQTNQSVGASYDTKNMMHCHRLLDMCIEIFKDKKLNVRRENAKELLDIRAGKVPYKDLLQSAREKIQTIKSLASASDLPDSIDPMFVSRLLLKMRKFFYGM